MVVLFWMLDLIIIPLKRVPSRANVSHVSKAYILADLLSPYSSANSPKPTPDPMYLTTSTF